MAAATANYQVVEGSVGSTVRLIARGAWDGTPVAANPAAGVITSVDLGTGGQVSPGDVVYNVDQRPVSAAAGTVPSFRDLAPGSSGQDVRQLQELLVALGLYEEEVDGVYGTGMAAAVVAWQESLGLTGDGAVLQGDLIVVPELPARLVPTADIRPGAVVVGGEPALAAVGDGPTFLVELPAGEPPVVSASSGVVVDPDGQRWEALVSGMAETPTGEPALTLTGADGGSVCGEDCGEAVPLGEAALYPVEITVVPTTTGPMVPVAALQPDGADGWMVRLADGGESPVTVLAAANGWAVVEGLAVGEEVGALARWRSFAGRGGAVRWQPVTPDGWRRHHRRRVNRAALAGLPGTVVVDHRGGTPVPTLEHFCKVDATLEFNMIGKTPMGVRIDMPFHGTATGPHWEGSVRWRGSTTSRCVVTGTWTSSSGAA